MVIRIWTVTSPPVICNDIIIVGSAVSDQPRFKESPPGHVRGFDARTGELRWTFHTIPQPNQFGYDTWQEGSAAYTGNAVLRSRLGDLKATTIHVFLKPDGRTLDRLEARGAVQLQLDGRWAAGESMTYHETEGRYEMEGSPVEMVEQIEPEEPETSVPGGAAPPPQDCRSTQGQALTFFRANDTIIVDGRERLRTETNNNDCEPLIF